MKRVEKNERKLNKKEHLGCDKMSRVHRMGWR